ncbi:hypothetical protein V1514DRAFT_319428 [Lipomyces japonicus]|uniref:uncharacterized protein n=1 Tax=Lipomyces japonicus TaxID=56871 RepID=UPI0034CEBFDD
MSSDLFFSLLRISTAQVLRLSGIDKCAPSVLDTVADLTVRYLGAITTRALENANLCGREELVIGDVRIAIESLGGLRPSRILDEHEYHANDDDDDNVEDEGLQQFLEWCGTVNNDFAKINGGENLVEGLKKRQIRNTQEDRFHGTVLDIKSSQDLDHNNNNNNNNNNNTSNNNNNTNGLKKIEIEGGPGPKFEPGFGRNQGPINGGGRKTTITR